MRRARRLRPSPAAVAVIATVLAGATTAAIAAIPDSGGTITGCYSRAGRVVPLGERKGTVRLIDAAAGDQCQADETRITWNQRGPQGDRGPAGPTGPQGATGPTGPQGPAGTVDTSAFYTKTESDDLFLRRSAIAADELGSTVDSNGTTAPGVGSTPECLLGTMMPFAGQFAPRGWGFANGQTVNILDYQALFSLLGTIYGGDGMTTFALPNAHDVGPGRTNWIICMVGVFPGNS